MKEWERIVRSRPILKKVTDLQGHPIYTDDQLFTYLQQFEGDFAAMPGRVIDATEGGVHKAGTQVMSLAEVAARFCQRDIPADRLAYRDQLNWHDGSRLTAGRAEVQRRIQDVAEMSKACEDMLEILEELGGLTDRPAEFNRRITRVDALRVKIRQMSQTYELISAVAQQAELQRFSADRRMGRDEGEGAARARQQLKRDVRFVEAIRDGAEALRAILEECIERFDAAIALTKQKKEQSNRI